MGIVPAGLQHGRCAKPKLVIAIADYGQYGAEKEQTNRDGDKTQRPLQMTPDGRPIWMPWVLERALLCRRLDWKIMPDQLDGMGTDLKRSLQAVTIFDAFQRYGQDINSLTEDDAGIVAAIDKVRMLIGRRNA